MRWEKDAWDDVSMNWSDWHLKCTYKAEIEEQVSGGRVRVGKKIPELLETEVGKRLKKVLLKMFADNLLAAPPPGCPQGPGRPCPPAGPLSGSLRPWCFPSNWSSLLITRSIFNWELPTHNQMTSWQEIIITITTCMISPCQRSKANNQYGMLKWLEMLARRC